MWTELESGHILGWMPYRHIQTGFFGRVDELDGLRLRTQHLRVDGGEGLAVELDWNYLRLQHPRLLPMYRLQPRDFLKNKINILYYTINKYKF